MIYYLIVQMGSGQPFVSQAFYNLNNLFEYVAFKLKSDASKVKIVEEGVYFIKLDKVDRNEKD